jgi:DNA mismatch endonuclease (patch repair protein)
MDRISVERRSWNMSRIKAKNTKPEITVRSLLHRMGFRFRLHVRRLPGCPDIVLPRLKSVVFVHGCFWHRHRKCSFAYSPKTRKAFWKSKFEDNVRRDRRHLHDLAELGWRALVIWECQIRDLNVIADRLSRFLSDR